MTPDESPWTPAEDDALRSLLSLAVDEHPALPDPAFVRARGERIRRRRWAVRTGVAAAVVAAAAGVAFAVTGRADGPAPTPPPVIASRSVTPTVGPTPSETLTGSPSPGPSAATSTDVIGEDGSLGPFRLGMTEAQVADVIARDYRDGSVRLEDQVFGGGFDTRVIVQDGVETGIPGTTPGTGVIGILDTHHDGSGILDALVAPSTATLRGLGVGSSVTAFERAFPGRVTPDDASTTYLLDLDGARLQLGRPAAFLDPSAVDTVVILPPGAEPFSDYPYFTS